MVDCKTFNPALWEQQLISLAVVLGIFFTTLTVFLSSAVVVNLFCLQYVYVAQCSSGLLFL